MPHLKNQKSYCIYKIPCIKFTASTIFYHIKESSKKKINENIITCSALKMHI